MCLFWIVVSAEDNARIARGPEMCVSGLSGRLCLDINKSLIYRDNGGINSKCGNLTVSTSSELTLVLENVMTQKIVTVERSLIDHHISQSQDLSPKEIYELYLNLRRSSIESKHRSCCYSVEYPSGSTYRSCKMDHKSSRSSRYPRSVSSRGTSGESPILHSHMNELVLSNKPGSSRTFYER